MNRTGQFFSLLWHMLTSCVFVWIFVPAFCAQITLCMWSEISTAFSTMMPIFWAMPFVIAGSIVSPDLGAQNSQTTLTFQPSFLRCYAIDRSVITLSRLGLYWSTLLFLATLILGVSLLRPNVTLLFLDKPTALALQELFPQATQTDSRLIIPGAKIFQGSLLITGLFLAAALSQLLATCVCALKGKRWIYWGAWTLVLLVVMSRFWTHLIKNPASIDGITLMTFARHWPWLASLTGILIIVTNIFTMKRDRSMEYL